MHDAAGHIGFIGRAGVFLFVSVLFFRLISNPSVNSSDATTIGNGLAQLQKNHGGRACLFILGFFLIIYGLFAVSHLLFIPALDAACDFRRLCRASWDDIPMNYLRTAMSVHYIQLCSSRSMHHIQLFTQRRKCHDGIGCSEFLRQDDCA